MNLLNFDSGLWFKKPRPDCQFCLCCLFCQNEFKTYFKLFEKLDNMVEQIRAPGDDEYEGYFWIS
jgi:hypothetical protein